MSTSDKSIDIHLKTEEIAALFPNDPGGADAYIDLLDLPPDVKAELKRRARARIEEIQRAKYIMPDPVEPTEGEGDDGGMRMF